MFKCNLWELPPSLRFSHSAQGDIISISPVLYLMVMHILKYDDFKYNTLLRASF